MASETFHIDSVLPATTTGAPVLCVHGLGAGTWAFEELLPLIAERGHPAHAVSYRGHAPNPLLADIGRQSLADFVDDAEAAARTLDHPIVIGHSMGGLIALLLMARRAVRGAILVSSAPPRWIPAMTPTLLMRMPRYLPAMLLNRPFMMSDRDIDELALNRIPAEQRAALRARFTPDSGRAVRQIAVGAFAVTRDDIAGRPLCVMGADDDRFIPVSVARALARKFSARLHIAPGHGHFMFGEPGWRAQAAVILDWVDSISGGAEPIGPASANDEGPPGIHHSSSSRTTTGTA